MYREYLREYAYWCWGVVESSLTWVPCSQKRIELRESTTGLCSWCLWQWRIFLEAYLDSSRFSDDLTYMLLERPGWFWTIMWRFVSPVIVLAIFVSSIVNLAMKPPAYSVWRPNKVTEWFYHCSLIVRCYRWVRDQGSGVRGRRNGGNCAEFVGC